MAMTSPVFRGAKGEVRSSLDELLPLDGDGASIGYVDRAADARSHGEEGAGYLLAIEGATRDRIERIASDVLGEKCERIVAPHQAAVCLGECEAAELVVSEIGALGDRQDTLVRDGAVVELRRDGVGEAPALTLPSGISDAVQPDISRLAIGAASLDRFAAQATEPLVGAWTPGWRRALPVVASSWLARWRCGGSGTRTPSIARSLHRRRSETKWSRSSVWKRRRLNCAIASVPRG